MMVVIHLIGLLAKSLVIREYIPQSPREFLARVFHRSVLQEFLTRVCCKVFEGASSDTFELVALSSLSLSSEMKQQPFRGNHDKQFEVKSKTPLLVQNIILAWFFLVFEDRENEEVYNEKSCETVVSR